MKLEEDNDTKLLLRGEVGLEKYLEVKSALLWNAKLLQGQHNGVMRPRTNCTLMYCFSRELTLSISTGQAILCFIIPVGL